jgi:hypothetical protein
MLRFRNTFWNFIFDIKARVDRRPENERDKQTHLCLAGTDGGKFFVEERYAEQFLEEYSKYIQNNLMQMKNGVPEQNLDHLYLNELRTPVFRFVFDLDYAQAFVLTREAELLLYQTMYTTLRKFYPPNVPDDIFDLIVTAAEDKKFPPDDAKRPNWFKYGRHGCFKNLYVNDQIAATLREGILAAIDEIPALTRTEDCNGWTDVFDAAIYRANGLRMPYSHKIDKCHSCPAIRKECPKCRGVGHIDAGRVYVPYMALRRGIPSNRALADLRDPAKGVFVTVKQTSLRLPSDAKVTPGFKTYANCPVPKLGENMVHVEMQDGSQVREFKEDYKARQPYRNHLRVSPGSLEWNTIQEYIRRHLPDPFKRVRVKDITYPANLQYYHALLQGNGCNYCMNIGGNHRKNTSYFVFRPTGVTQKCHCRCDTVDGRKYGLCSKYESQKFALPTQSRDILFPSAATKNAGALEVSRNMEKRLSRNEYYVAVKNVVSRLAELIQSNNRTQVANEELKRVHVVKPKKVIKDKPPPKKRRKTTAAAAADDAEAIMDWS